MESKIRNLIVGLVTAMLGMFYTTENSFATETESPITCVEGAEPLALAYGNNTVGCSINPAVDTDRFTFTGTINDQIRINVISTSTNMDPVLEVRDPVGNLVATANCSNLGCSFSLNLTLPQSGIYLLTLSDSGTNEAGNYILQLEKLLPAPNTQRLDYDRDMVDGINPATDIDHFHFNGKAGTSIRLNALSTSTHMDPTIEVRDPSGALVLNGAADGANCNNFGCSFSVDLIPALTGKYSLIIYDAGTNEAGDYQLSLWCVVGTCDSDGNGQPDIAPPVLSYVVPIIDSITPAVDGDLFTFNGTAGTSIRLNALSTSTHLDPTIEVRDPNGALVLNGAVDGAGCSNFGCSFSVDLIPALTGKYSLLIYDAGTNEAGDYQLSLWCILGDCDSDGDGFIDNDREVTKYGDAKIKNIDPAVDADYYIFKGTAGDQVRISMLSTTTHMDPTIEVYDPNGTRILNGAANGASCSNFGCSFSVDIFPAITGTYSVALYDSATNEAGGYQFGLQCVFSPGDFVCDNITTTPSMRDNCSVVANPTQLDTDGDGYGNRCDADFDNNGFVNITDLGIFKSRFGTTNAAADLDGNGFVNITDLGIFKSLFGKAPGPSGVAP